MIRVQFLRHPNSRLPLDNPTGEYNAKNYFGIARPMLRLPLAHH